MKNLPKIIVILGATATGKTALAVRLARRIGGEIISADSRQVYTGMDIGTGKDLAVYGRGAERVAYHLIDVADPAIEPRYDLKRYQEEAYKAINGVLKRKKVPIVVGGSGLYLQAVVDGYSLSEAANKTPRSEASLTLEAIQAKLGARFLSKLNPSEQKNKRRLLRYLEIMEQSEEAHNNLHGTSKPRYESLVFGLDYSIATIRKNIKKRLDDRFGQGMIDEVASLHKAGLSWDKLESFGLEYKYISLYLKKLLPREEMEEKLYLASGQFAKRQLTWFRRWEKQGREIAWIKATDDKKVLRRIQDFLETSE